MSTVWTGWTNRKRCWGKKNEKDVNDEKVGKDKYRMKRKRRKKGCYGKERWDMDVKDENWEWWEG